MKFNYLKRVTALGMATIMTTSATVFAVETPEVTSEPNDEVVNDDNTEKPNVVYIVLDDLGYSDFGSYGSTINTPNIDQLAEEGLIYTDYYTQPLSSPSRAALLTGSEANEVGMGIIGEVDFGEDVPNVNGVIYPEYGTIADTLGENGYNTIAVGKWHIGSMDQFTPWGDKEEWPSGKGFDKNYNFVAGAANQFTPGGVIEGDEFVVPDYENDPDYHFTNEMVDKSLEYIDESDDPFFLYFATGAMHGPLNVQKEYIERYEGKYAHGWEEERRIRFENQKELGFFDEDVELPPRLPGVPEWDEMTDVQRTVAERHQEVYAGYLEHTDEQIGRFINELKARDLYDNTIFVVTSDNGATPSGMTYGSPEAHKNENAIATSAEEQIEYIDEFGSAEFGTEYNSGWAWVSNTPFRYHKATTFNGGTRVPLIVTWKDGITEPGRMVRDTVQSIDVTPTMYDVVGVEQVMEIDGVAQEPMDGQSFAQTFTSTEPLDNEIDMIFIVQDCYFYTDGEYSIVANSDGSTAMFDFKNDPTQIYDLKEEMPEKYDELWAKFEIKKREINSENLVMDVLHRVDRDVVIERYGQLAIDVYKALDTGVLPEDEEARRLSIILLSYREKVGESGYVGLATSWYIDPDSPLAEEEFRYYTEDGMFFTTSSAPVQARTHTIASTIYSDDPEGVIVANGGSDGGYVLYIDEEGYLNYEYNFVGERYKITSDIKVPAGKTDIRFTYNKKDMYTGDGTLRINGEIVGEGEVKTLPIFVSYDYFGVGADYGTNVSEYYEGDYPFNGTIEYVDVFVGDDIYINN